MKLHVAPWVEKENPGSVVPAGVKLNRSGGMNRVCFHH